MNIQQLMANAPYKIKAIHITGICKKDPRSLNCKHQKNIERVARYQTKEKANDAKARFEAHGFNVELIKS